jgi:alkylation response protein AidB-like acyl-CoA dehydrogenase
MPFKDRIHDPQHWRDRAAQMRVLAEGMQDPQARRLMILVANDYDKLADRAARRAAAAQSATATDPPTQGGGPLRQ